MPTGYTADIDDKTTFQDFALRCARAFGALIELRDEPLSASIPQEFKPSDYHANALQEAREKLTKLKRMSYSEVQAAHHEAEKERYAARIKSIVESEKTRANYERVLTQVRAWTPPSSDHVEMKTFMIQQLEDSMRNDCHDEKFLNECYPTVPGVDVWLEKQIQSAKRNIDYHRDEYAKEVERCKSRTEWVRALRESLRAEGGR